MSSHIRKVTLPTRSRGRSTDVNNGFSLVHRALLTAVMSLRGDQRTGVLRGLEVSLNGTDLNASISEGVAIVDNPSPATYDPPWNWIELSSTLTVDLSSYVDANPRWVCIGIQANEVAEEQDTRQIWNEVTGTPSVSLVDIVTASSPTAVVTAGTPDAVAPILPNGVANTIPLAYVLIPGGATSVPASNYILCRPMVYLGVDNAGTIGSSKEFGHVNGGGIDVDVLASARLHAFSGVFPSTGQKFAGDYASLSQTPTGRWDGGALPAGTAPVYVYACRVPYPPGHDSSLAEREFSIGSGATSYTDSGITQADNCLVLFSETEPQSNGTGYDFYGHPSAALSLTDAVFGGAATIATADAVYLGSVSYDAGAFWYQTTSGSTVMFRSNITVESVPVGSPGASTNVDPRVGDGATGRTICNIAETFYLGVRYQYAGAGTLELTVTDFSNVHEHRYYTDGIGTNNVWHRFWSTNTTGGYITFQTDDQGGNGTSILVYTEGYIDPILGSR